MKRSELLQKWKDIQKSGLSRTDGGSGSGNWGHAGRPGHRGGSAGGGGKSNRVSLQGGGFTSHQRERKVWNNRFSTAFDARTPQEADDHYREQAGTVWQGLSEQSRYALYSYTSQDYSDINDPLRAHQKPDPRTKDITDAIEKCTFERDAVVYRGATFSATEKLFGLPKGSIQNMDLKALTALEGKDEAFNSCTARSPDYPSSVNMEIIVPKGSKGMYLEPISAFGDGPGLHWDSRLDGKSKQSTFTVEQEILLQRGTKFRIHEATRNGKNITLKVIVTGQEYDDLS